MFNMLNFFRRQKSKDEKIGKPVTTGKNLEEEISNKISITGLKNSGNKSFIVPLKENFPEPTNQRVGGVSIDDKKNYLNKTESFKKFEKPTFKDIFNDDLNIENSFPKSESNFNEISNSNEFQNTKYYTDKFGNQNTKIINDDKSKFIQKKFHESLLPSVKYNSKIQTNISEKYNQNIFKNTEKILNTDNRNFEIEAKMAEINQNGFVSRNGRDNSFIYIDDENDFSDIATNNLKKKNFECDTKNFENQRPKFFTDYSNLKNDFFKNPENNSSTTERINLENGIKSKNYVDEKRIGTELENENNVQKNKINESIPLENKSDKIRKNMVQGFEKTIFEFKKPESEKILNTNIIKQNFSVVSSNENRPESELKFQPVPQIQVTDCSDSDGENEVIILGNSYEIIENRPYPSILSDIEEDDEPFSDASDIEPNNSNLQQRNVVHQETKFQEQLKNLKTEIEDKEIENGRLRNKIEDLEKSVSINKTRIVKDLAFENEKTKQLQNELDHLKIQIADLQKKLETNENEKNKLQTKANEVFNEKDSELKIMRSALENLENQKQNLEMKFKNEYEKLRTVNSDREQQLLDDFEWKLREVEQSCKRKVEEKQEKFIQMEQLYNEEVKKLKADLHELDKLRTYEAELVQLRGLTNEQQRSLKIATKTSEQLQSNEKSLNEEILRLRSSLEKERNHLTTVQGIHSREILEKDRKHQFKLEQQRNEITSEWEDKLRRELTRLRLDLEKGYKDERRTIIEESRIKMEKEIKDINQIWEKKNLEVKKEFDRLQKKLLDEEENHKEEILKMQSNTDRDMLELRRKIDKLDMSYQEQLEKKDLQYEKELEKIKSDCEKRIQQCEKNWSEQINATRRNLQTMKEQMQREADEQLEIVNRKHNEYAGQYDELMEDKEAEISHMEEKHARIVHDMQNHFEEELEALRTKSNEIHRTLEKTCHDLSEKNMYIESLEKNMESVQRNNISLNERIASLENIQKEFEFTLQKQECEHNKIIYDIRKQHENEIQNYQLKIFSNEPQELQEQHLSDLNTSPDCEMKSDECCVMSCAPSRASRRKGKGRHRANKNNTNSQHPQFSKQLSSSSV